MGYATDMIRFIALFMAAFTAITSTSLADEPIGQPVLVELFANQNCSACPQAHRTMNEMQETRDDVLVLTWVVDYWDYLGEPDPMALPEANARQAAYTDWLELRAPYTPQSVYNGVKECPGPRRKQVLDNITALAGRQQTGVRLIDTGGLISVASAAAEDLRLIRVDYLPANAHDTGMVNPVVGVTNLNGLQGVEHECRSDCAVLLQSFKSGEVFAIWQPEVQN